MSNINKILAHNLKLTKSQTDFFIGWCKEGGEEFEDILLKLIEVVYSRGLDKGFDEGYDLGKDVNTG